MNASRKLVFSAEDHALYEKLHASSQDLGSASSYGAFILEKQWEAKPWSRGSTYLQQSAFVTAMVVSYARPFTRSEGWPRLPNAFLEELNETEVLLHQRVLTLRHQVYAHSDSISYEVIPWKSDHHSDISRTPIFEFKHDEICILQNMCRKIRERISCRMSEIKEKYA